MSRLVVQVGDERLGRGHSVRERVSVVGVRGRLDDERLSVREREQVARQFPPEHVDVALRCLISRDVGDSVAPDERAPRYRPRLTRRDSEHLGRYLFESLSGRAVQFFSGASALGGRLVVCHRATVARRSKRPQPEGAPRAVPDPPASLCFAGKNFFLEP